MARLSASERDRLPDSAFAYVDSRGRRRLPIHDEAHVRNALARFGQVRFEDDAARERARSRLLKAAKRYGIVPVGFITGQLQAERARPPSTPEPLPSGGVTLLMTDIEASTALLRRLGEGYARLLAEVREVLVRAVERAGGRVVEVRADELFAVFHEPSESVAAAAEMQRTLRATVFEHGVQVRVRVGIHSGTVTLADTGYIGLAVHTVARVSAAARGGQVLLSAATASALEGCLPEGLELRSTGRYQLAGLQEPEELFQLEGAGLDVLLPDPSNAPAQGTEGRSGSG